MRDLPLVMQPQQSLCHMSALSPPPKGKLTGVKGRSSIEKAFLRFTGVSAAEVVVDGIFNIPDQW